MALAGATAPGPPVSWLERALQPAVVMAELTGDVPDLVDGRVTLVACRISRVRAAPERDTWSAVYELDLQDRAGHAWTCVAEGVLTPPGRELAAGSVGIRLGDGGWARSFDGLRLSLTVPTSDDALPGLRAITDPVGGRRLVERVLRAAELMSHDAELTGCVPDVVAYKPGVRATLVCHLAYPAGAGRGPPAVVVKVHHDDSGARAFAAMSTLSGSGVAVRVPHALAYLPELRLAVYEHVDHRESLKDLFHRAFDGGSREWHELLTATRSAGAGLAAVHGCRDDGGVAGTWDEELAAVRTKAVRLGRQIPALAASVGSVPVRLAAAAAATSADAAVAVHHSFRPAQVLLTEGGVVFIDFDKFCRSEPASDLALFTVKLRHMAANKLGDGVSARERGPRGRELEAAFLDGYSAHRDVSSARVALWQALELTSLVLSAAKKVNPAWQERCRQMLEDHLVLHGW